MRDDEKTTGAAFDAALNGDPRFTNVYHEVKGRYTNPSPYGVDRQPRIARVLIPSRSLQAAGWVHGPIGVELKAPGTKIGKPLAQCIDYTRAVFEIKPGFHVPVGMVFLCPVTMLRGDLESVAVHNRVGTANITPRGELVFFRGSTRIISAEENHRNFIELRKVGSR